MREVITRVRVNEHGTPDQASRTPTEGSEGRCFKWQFKLWSRLIKLQVGILFVRLLPNTQKHEADVRFKLVGRHSRTELVG